MTTRDVLDSGLGPDDVAPPDPNAPLLTAEDLAVLLRFGTANAARRFAKKHLMDARLAIFGGTHRWDRRRVLEILGIKA